MLTAAAFPPLAAGWNKRGGAVLLLGFAPPRRFSGGPRRNLPKLDVLRAVCQN